MRIVYMGTPDFAVPVLEALHEAGHDIVFVVTRPDSMRDRGKKVKFSPVKEKALELGLEILQPEKIKQNEEFLNAVKNVQPDAVVVAAYGNILPKALLEVPGYGCLNVHGSLLPRFRGAAPIQRAIMEGDDETGITIMCMDEGLDTGDMLARVSTPIGGKTAAQLHDELAMMGAGLMVETLKKVEAGDICPEEQDDSLATYAPMISKSEGHIDFTQEPDRIERTIRAFDPWPGTYAYIGGKPFKIWKAEAIPNFVSGSEPGTIVAVDKCHIDIAAGSGILRVLEVQAPGRKRVAAGEFLKGNYIEIGTVLI